MRARRWMTVIAVVAVVAVFAVGMTLILHAEAHAATRDRAVGVPETTPPSSAVVSAALVTAPDLTTSAASTTAVSTTSSPPPATTTSRSSASTPPAATTAAAPKTRAITPKTSVTTPKTSPSTSKTSTTKPSPSAAATTSSSTFQIVKPTGEPVADGSADQVSDAVDAAVEQAAENGVDEHVVVADRSTGNVLASQSAEATVPSMSVVKLFVAADALELDGGAAGMNSGDLQRLHDMIEYSDDEIMQDYYDADGGDAIITRTIQRYGLQDTTPTPEERYWGDVKISARDMASFLQQALASSITGPFLEAAMTASADTGADGFDQDFGMNAIPGAGSKQGWGCCLGDVDAIHSVGFTANRIVVVLSGSDPDKSPDNLGTAAQLANDSVTQAAVTAVTRTAAVAVHPDS